MKIITTTLSPMQTTRLILLSFLLSLPLVSPLLLAQPILSAWGANTSTNQTGTAHWAYYSVSLPSGYAGMLLQAENLANTGSIEVYVQRGTQNPTETTFLKKSDPGASILEVTAADSSSGDYRIGLLYKGANATSAANTRLRLVPNLPYAPITINNDVVNGRDVFFRVILPDNHSGFRAL